VLSPALFQRILSLYLSGRNGTVLKQLQSISQPLTPQFENVIANAIEADIGSIFGWGFAAQTGGVISYVETILGLENFIKLADDLAENVGQRYALPEMVREKAAKGESFYG